MSDPTQFNFNKFNNQLQNPDTDFTIIAFNDLIKHLNVVQEFDLSADIIKDQFTPLLISRLQEKIDSIVHPIFRIIVLLSEKLPIPSLSSFFDQIFNFVGDSECQIRTQILSVLREVLSNSVSYPYQRQQEIVKFFINKLNGNGDIEILIFNIDLMATLLEKLGSLFDESNTTRAEDLLLAYINDQRPDVLSSIASLAKIWMTIAINIIPDHFDEMIKRLYKIGEENKNAFAILSSMTCYKPSIYQKESENLILLFCDRIQKEEDEVAQLIDEDPGVDIFADTQYVTCITDYVSALTSLVKTFPEKCNNEIIDNLKEIAFRYLIYGSDESPTNEDLNDVNENDEDDDAADGFVVEGGKEGDQMELDEADDEIVTGDDSWKIRKVAMALSTVLIQCFPEQFYDTLGYRDEEVNCLGNVNVLLKDTDSGAQKDAFDFLRVVIHYYKDYLGADDVTLWFSTLQYQLTTKDAQSIASTVIDTITYVLREYRVIPENLLCKIILCIIPLINNNTIQPALSFVLTIFKVIMSATPQLVSAIAKLLNEAIHNQNVSATVPYIQVAAKLFVYCMQIEEQISKCSEIANLVNSIMDSTKQADKNMQAFEALGVFVAAFSEDIFGLFGAAFDIIVDALENEVALKQVCGSISLIAASRNSREKISAYADRICSKLCAILLNDIVHIDNAYLFRFLWTLFLLLEKNIVDPMCTDCEKVAPYLAEIFSANDERNTLLSISIFNLLPNFVLSSLNSIKIALQGQNLSHQIVNSYAHLVVLCGKKNIETVEKFIDDLISEYLRESRAANDEIAQNVAFVIGFAASKFENLAQKLLKDFEERIQDKKNTPTWLFVLQCVGEIGSLIDISGWKNLVDTVFGFVGSQDRELFNAAAECIGHLAVGSMNKVLPRVLDEALKVTDSSVWILATLSMAKRLSFIDPGKLMEMNDKFSTIFDFLIQNSDYSKATEKSIAQSFCYLLKLNPEKFIDILIKVMRENEKAGPVAAHGVSLFFEDITSSSDPCYCFRFIEEVMNLFNPSNPRVSEHVILCLKLCLHVKEQRQNSKATISDVDTDFVSLSQDYLDSFNMDEYREPILAAAKFDKETQLVKLSLGIETAVYDIGINLRSNAINCIILMFKIDPTAFNCKEIFDMCFEIIVNDQSDEVKASVCALLTQMALEKELSSELYDLIAEKKEEDFVNIEAAIFPRDKPKVDFLEDGFFRLLVAFRNLTENRRIATIEKMYANYTADQKVSARIKKLESEISYHINDAPPYAILNEMPASVILMKKFYKSASIIFTI